MGSIINATSLIQVVLSPYGVLAQGYGSSLGVKPLEFNNYEVWVPLTCLPV